MNASYILHNVLNYDAARNTRDRVMWCSRNATIGESVADAMKIEFPSLVEQRPFSGGYLNVMPEGHVTLGIKEAWSDRFSRAHEVIAGAGSTDREFLAHRICDHLRWHFEDADRFVYCYQLEAKLAAKLGIGVDGLALPKELAPPYRPETIRLWNSANRMTKDDLISVIKALRALRREHGLFMAELKEHYPDGLFPGAALNCVNADIEAVDRFSYWQTIPNFMRTVLGKTCSVVREDLQPLSDEYNMFPDPITPAHIVAGEKLIDLMYYIEAPLFAAFEDRPWRDSEPASAEDKPRDAAPAYVAESAPIVHDTDGPILPPIPAEPTDTKNVDSLRAGDTVTVRVHPPAIVVGDRVFNLRPGETKAASVLWDENEKSLTDGQLQNKVPKRDGTLPNTGAPAQVRDIVTKHPPLNVVILTPATTGGVGYRLLRRVP